MKQVLQCVALAAMVIAPQAHAATEIRFWHAMNGALGTEVAALAEQFNSAQDKYKVVPEYKGNYDETMNAAFAAYRAGKAPHVAQVFEVGTADMMAAKNAVRPLWQVMGENGKSLDAKTFLPPVASYYSDAQGRLVALPFNNSTPVLYINEDAFRKAKLDPSVPPKTWYDMPKAMDAILDSGAKCAYTTTWPSWVLLENMSAWHNQEFATRDNGLAGLDTKLVFNSKLMMRWVSILASWHKSGYFTYSGRGDEGEARFVSGECAMLTSSSAAYSALAQNAKFPFRVAQLPYYDDFPEAPQNTLIGGAALWVMSGGSRDEYRGVAEFLSFLSKPEVQARWHQRTGYVPLTRAAYKLSKDEGFYIKHPGHEVAIRQLLLRNPTRESKGIRLGFFRQIRAIIDEEMEGVWNGGKAPMDALNNAVERGNGILAGFARANGVAHEGDGQRTRARQRKAQQ